MKAAYVARVLMTDANRPSELATLRNLLREPQRGLNICAISGPGGVGKSFLLRAAFEEESPAAQGYVHLQVDAANAETRADFFGVLEQLFRRSLPPPAVSGKDYFPSLRRTAQLHRELLGAVEKELSASPAMPDLVKQGLLGLLKAGHLLNKNVPRTGSVLKLVADHVPGWKGLLARVGQLGLEAAGKTTEADLMKALDDAAQYAQKLTSLNSEVGKLRKVLGLTTPDRLRRELFSWTAEQLMEDLSAAIGGYRSKDRFKFVHGKIEGVSRLLLVLDDYEILSPLLGEFFVGSLVHKLATANFDTVLIILCREELENTHEGWAQHCRPYLREQLRLNAFNEATALKLLAEAGVAEERRAALYEATQGYPYLLSLVIEEAGQEGADSALFLRRFYDRTTRWMNAVEREWFERLCYVERVNEDTLAPLFPDDDVRQVVDWFEREPSIRDPSAAYWRVRPLVREKVLRYLELRAPSRHRERLAAVPGM